jgi:hypothetical protein
MRFTAKGAFALNVFFQKSLRACLRPIFLQAIFLQLLFLSEADEAEVDDEQIEN